MADLSRNRNLLESLAKSGWEDGVTMMNGRSLPNLIGIRTD
jgi:hypothetical protein